MANTAYSQKIQSPFWQKKRLEIFQRDNWACVKCKCTTRSLQVHHKRYVYGKEPWEYENKDLVTFCDSCHAGEHNLRPAPISEVLTKIEYEGLYKETPTVLVTIDEQIKELQQTLKSTTDESIEMDVLKNIMFLQGKRKELQNGNR